MSRGATRRTTPRGLARDDYEAILRAASTNRARLVVRLAGEVGLRPFEIATVSPGNVRTVVVDGTLHYLLRVTAGDDDRDAYVPAELRRELDRYATGNDIDSTEQLFDVSVRRLQMLVADVAAAAADETGREHLRNVSSSDLRHFFARDLLVERGVPPGVVMAVGGWTQLSSLGQYVDQPSPEDVVRAFETDDEPAASRSSVDVQRVLDGVDRPVVVFDQNATIVDVNDRYEATTSRSASAVVGEGFAELTISDASVQAAVWETVVAGDAWEGPLQLRDDDGDPVDGHATVTPVPAPDEASLLFVVTFDREPASAALDDGRTARFERVQQAIREIGGALAEATTRETVLSGVCETLSASTAYECAWVSDAGNETAAPHVWAGADDGTVEQLAFADDGPTRGLADRVIADRSVVSEPLDPADRPRTEGTVDPRSVVGTPLVHDGSVFGALCLATQATEVGTLERRALANLGERVAEAIAAAERKRLLLADTVLELEFRCTDASSFVVDLSRKLGCTIRLEGIVPVDADSLLYYISVEGASPEAAHAHADEVLDDARLVADYENSSLLEVTASDDSLVTELVDHGGTVETLVAEDGEARLVCEFVPDTDVREIVAAVTEAFPETELVVKREVADSVTSPAEFHRSLAESLTEKQLAALQAAFHAGYFDWPRDSTAEELADSLGVSSPTLHNHLRRGQRKLLTAFLDE
ncbi:bacterio-opsin activator domain-containing protein [Haloarchaeobius sp. HRN-SO-5]|uniref:bacterio-opsin activator domain-containing protein n=1 Tax=Haloarchaeobius sp. HRN-SO-5 TaxID=3446118 RepID=UPI003EB6A342